MRIAELLSKHNFRGTFYVPISNMEGRPVLARSDLDELGRAYEIGGHTLTHCYLNKIAHGEAKRQIIVGKNLLEDQLGRSIKGFCYPGGWQNKSIRHIVQDAGFYYARTTANFYFGPHSDVYRMPTTLQLYPHARKTYVLNFAKKLNWQKRKKIFLAALKGDNMLERLIMAFHEASSYGVFFHLWGHSWELEEIGGWNILDDFLKYVSEYTSREARVDNWQLNRVLLAEGISPNIINSKL